MLLINYVFYLSIDCLFVVLRRIRNIEAIRANINMICGFLNDFFSRLPKTIGPYGSKLSAT